MVAQPDLFAPPPMPALAIEPNEHGVYPCDDAERLVCPNPRKGWQGAPWAEIRLLHVREGWIWSTATMWPQSGHGGPLTTHDTLPNRAEALERAAADLLRRCIGMRGTPDQKPARAVMAWLDTLA